MPRSVLCIHTGPDGRSGEPGRGELSKCSEKHTKLSPDEMAHFYVRFSLSASQEKSNY
jgi:hypothetical protein